MRIGRRTIAKYLDAPAPKPAHRERSHKIDPWKAAIVLKAEWRETGNGPMAKFYTLTAAGRTCLRQEMEQWQRYAGAVAMVLES